MIGISSHTFDKIIYYYAFIITRKFIHQIHVTVLY